MVVADDARTKPHAEPRAALAGEIAIVAWRPFGRVRVRTRCVRRVARVDGAWVAILARNTLAETLAVPGNTQTRVPVSLTKGTIDFVGIGAASIVGIAHVFGAVVPVVARHELA